jgi:hypothetical protein
MVFSVYVHAGTLSKQSNLKSFSVLSVAIWISRGTMKSVIWRLVKIFKGTENLIHIKHVHFFKVVTEEQLAEVSERLTASPRKSLWKTCSTNRNIMQQLSTMGKKLGMFPYKMQVMHQLLPPDCE